MGHQLHLKIVIKIYLHFGVIIIVRPPQIELFGPNASKFEARQLGISDKFLFKLVTMSSLVDAAATLE